MRNRLVLGSISLVVGLVVLGFLLALRARAFPLGVPGEWEWPRLPVTAFTSPVELVIAAGGAVGFAVVAGLGYRGLRGEPTRAREAAWVVGLVVASILAQIWLIESAPPGYGLERWVIALHQKGSSGYFTIARDAAPALGPFLANYPEWIERQDALHIGTHPPGLIVAEAGLLRFYTANPAMARFVAESAPVAVTQAFRFYLFRNPATSGERATLVTVGLLTLLGCAATVVPLYVLGRLWLSPAGAWCAVTLWPLAPSPILFQPTSDTALPLLAMTALACAGHATRLPPRRALSLSLAAGVVLALGMQLSLVFLAVGLIVALVTVAVTWPTWPTTARLLLMIGVGFLGTTLLIWALTRANPFWIWWANQRNHARFYVEYPRDYLAWIVANPIELIVGLGLPVTVWGLTLARQPGRIPSVTVVTLLVLAVLTLTGRNLSEVGRLWLPMMPALLLAAGAAMQQWRAGPLSLGVAVMATASQTIGLQTFIQVIYPI